MNLSQYINATVAKSDDEFVRQIRNVLKRYKEFFDKNSNRHKWKFTPTDVLGEILKNETSLKPNETPYNFYRLNKLYHDDIESDIKGLQQVYIFRVNALLESCINLVNKKDYLSAGIIARSLVELCAVSLHHAAMVEVNYKVFAEKLPDRALTTRITDLSYVREILERGIWGSRLPDIVDRNKGIKQFHVMKILKKIADKEKVKYLEPMYDFLCEATHPNLMGNFQFISTPNGADFTNPINIIIDKHQSGDASSELLEKTLGAISWSAIAVSGMHGHFQGALDIKKEIFLDHTDKGTLH